MLPLAGRQPNACIIGGDRDPWLAVGDDTEAFNLAGECVAVPAAATSWHLLVLSGVKGRVVSLSFAGATRLVLKSAVARVV